jgi:hypothetical protein
MRALVASPWAGGEAIELGSDLWRKKLLPVGQLDYKGRVLNFDADYLRGLAEAFDSGAYDQVAFQIADGSNAHTNDPERYRGEVVSMHVQPDGLYVDVRTTEAGNALLQTNPRLGISARIIEDYARSDGKFYPHAVQHVLGTLDPRIPALGDWEQVDFSGGDDFDYVIDLSSVHFAGEDPPEPVYASGGDDDPDGEDEYDLTEDELVALIDSMSDEEFADLLAEFGLLQDESGGGPQPAYNGNGPAQLSGGGYDDLGEAIDMAAVQAMTRLAEDEAPPSRRDEDRLAWSLDRLQRGTYLPSVAERQLGFASDDYGLDDVPAGDFYATVAQLRSDLGLEDRQPQPRPGPYVRGLATAIGLRG